MKTQKSKHRRNGEVSAHGLLAKEAAAKKLAQAARTHLEAVKAEHKQARKAFKQAKKAAKRARKEARLAAKMLKTRNGSKVVKPKTVRRSKAVEPGATATRRSISQARLPLPVATPAVEPTVAAV